MRPFLPLLLPPLLLLAACTGERRMLIGTGDDLDDAAAPLDLSLDAAPAAGDLARNLDPDGACVVVAEEAKVELLPVDIIWIVDNSSSMQPAVAAVTEGLNHFATLIGGKNLDYHIVMLSLRSKNSPIQVGGSARYPVCIPPPLAGDAECGDGPRFQQSHIDVKSTQPLEQILGTLAQSKGYTAGQERGGPPWAASLRPTASKTIVVVTDDNSRFSTTDFEHFAGGANPSAGSVSLPAGILEASWKGLFDGYTFDGIYGWGSDADPSVKCKFPNGTSPASSGAVYTQLVAKTGGVRAKLCDGAAAWNNFFEQVAQAVARTSKLTCDLGIPPPPEGQQSVDPDQVNVQVVGGMGTTTLPKVKDAAACADHRGWYYDDDASPTRVLLCDKACEFAQTEVKGGGRIEVAFGCDTVVQ